MKLEINFAPNRCPEKLLKVRSSYLCTMVKHYTIPVFVPEEACPHRCIFCNQHHITSRPHAPTLEETQRIIETHLKTIPTDATIDIGFLGGNFTGISLNQQEAFLELAHRYLLKGRVTGIRISTRPDYINEHILDLQQRYGVSTIELGAQSMDDDVLRRAGRGHTSKETEIASKMIRTKGIRLGLQMMLGLPGDNVGKALHTARRIVEMGTSCTRIYPTLVVRNTPLEELWRRKKYTPLTMEDAVKQTLRIIPVFEEGGVHIIRIGLHPSEGFLDGSQLLDGPFHQSFKELVMTEKWNKMLNSYEWKKESRDVFLLVNPQDYNAAIGYRARNKKMLQQHYRKVKFVRDENIPKEAFHVDYH